MRAPALLVTIVVGLSLVCCCFAIPSCDRRMRWNMSFSPDELASARVGQPYQATLTAQDNDTPVGNLWLADGELPPGLTLTFVEGSDTAAITGTPEEAGTYTFTVAAWCFGTNVSGDEGQQAYTLVVQ